LAFLKIKKKSEWQYAEISIENQGFWVNTINHFIDYKLNDFNSINIIKWRNNQVKSFKHFFRLNQINGILSSGSSMILQVCNQVVVFLSVKALIDGTMTFGSMIAIQILIGMIYNPLLQIMSFFVELQATKLSFKRVNELNLLPSEMAINNLLSLDLTNNKEISLANVIFQYPNSTNVVLKGINFRILQSKTIVILGDSGSGKSTLLKIILGLYSPTFGDVFVGNTNLKAVNLFDWRKLFGVVTQESKIISGSILENITMSHENQDLVKVTKIVDIVCFNDDISNFYQGYETVIGEGGRGLSEGQKQKLLIARALYNNPDYLILDEATNSLDITVENRIMNNIRENFENITILLVAHRPQLAKIADLVIVIENGQVVENDFREKLELNDKSYFSKLIRS
jgi:ATP-binding cassette subfamily B protein